MWRLYCNRSRAFLRTATSWRILGIARARQSGGCLPRHVIRVRLVVGAICRRRRTAAPSAPRRGAASA